MTDTAVLNRFARCGILRHDIAVAGHLSRQAGFGELRMASQRSVHHVRHGPAGASTSTLRICDSARAVRFDNLLIVMASDEHRRRRIDRRADAEIAQRRFGYASEDWTRHGSAKWPFAPRGESA
jgi:hypothetical protein